MTCFVAALVLAGGLTGAADTFLRSLAPEQRARAQLSFEDPRRTRWHYTGGLDRKGLALRAMGKEQRQRAMRLLRSAMSERGFEKARACMALELHLGADPTAYHFTVFGEPKEKGTWGLSVEGHHLSLNWVVKDGALASVTPAFFGANPARVRGGATGPPAGTRLLAREEDLGFALLASLDAGQRRQAVVSDRTAADMNEAGLAQTRIGAPVGLPAAQMTPAQRERLRALIEVYVAAMPDAYARAVLQRLRLDEVHFAWYGAEKAGAGHSYRLQGPNLLILFFHARFNHAHSVWRTIGADFGA